jgi:hypothetical protein
MLPRKGSHFERKNYKNLCLRYSKIFIISYYTQIIRKKLYAIFFGTLMTRRSEKRHFYWTSEGGNSFREYFKNKPGNLFSNFDILLDTSQRTIYMKFKKNH